MFEDELNVTIFDVVTGEFEQREFTEQELLDYQETQNAAIELENEIKAKKAAKASALAKLAALGLTEEEIAAL